MSSSVTKTDGPAYAPCSMKGGHALDKRTSDKVASTAEVLIPVSIEGSPLETSLKRWMEEARDQILSPSCHGNLT